MNIWSSSVELFNLTELFIRGDGSTSPTTVYRKWEDNKSILLQPTKFPGKSPAVEKQLKEATKTPFNFDDESPAIILDQNFIDEALILSALFDLNEKEAAKLLRLGESMQSDWPEWPRGLVAVLLFYDTRLRRASTLKMLLREALLSKGSQCSRFFAQLVQEKLIISLIDCINSLNEEIEFERLDSVQALGPTDHRREVLHSYRQFHRDINDIILEWATEKSFDPNETKVLVNALASYDPPKFESPRGAPDTILGLIGCLTAASLTNYEKDGDFLVNCRQLLDISEWRCSSLKAFVKLVLAIASGHSFDGAMKTAFDRGLDAPNPFKEAFSNGALHFFLQFILPNPWLRHSSSLCDVFSYMFVIFLSTQHSVLRNFVLESGENHDETYHNIIRDDFQDIRQLLSPTANHQLSQKKEKDSISTLFDCLSTFYNFACDIVPDCVAAYWSSMNRSNQQQNNIIGKEKGLYLAMFVSFAGDILPADRYAKYVSMITSLISSDESTANGCFHFLMENSNANSDRRRVSLQHFQFTFQNIVSLLHQQLSTSPGASNNVASNFDDIELEALCSTVRLLAKIAKSSELCRQELYPMFISNTFSLVTSSIPSLLKVELFELASALIGTIQHSIQLWDIIEQSQLLPMADSTGQFSGGMWTELCNIETRLTTFPVTSSFLELLSSLMVYNVPIVLTERGIFEPVVSFVIDAVIPRLTNTTTTPNSTKELWTMCESSYKIITRLLEHLVALLSPSADPTSLWAGNLLLRHPGFLVYRSLLRAGSSFFKNSIKILKMAHSAIYSDAELPEFYELTASAALQVLDLFKICLEHAESFDEKLMSLPSFGAECHLSISQMLTTVESAQSNNNIAGNLGNLAAVMDFVGNSEKCLNQHCFIALKVVSILMTKQDCHDAIYNYLTLDVNMQIRVITRFVNCIEANIGVDAASPVAKKVQVMTVQTINSILQKLPAPNVAYLLLGLYYRRPVANSTLIELETGQIIKTCFKSIVAHLQITSDIEFACEGFKCLQRLCANEKTALPVLNLLRSSPPFLLGQLIDNNLTETLFNQDKVTAKHYSAVAALCHCLTVDLHMCSTSQLDLKSYVLKVCQILVQATSNFGNNTPLLLNILQELSFQHHSVALDALDRFSSFTGKSVAHLIRLLGSVNVETECSEGTRLSLFDVHKLHSYLAQIKAEYLQQQQASTQTQPELVKEIDGLVEEVLRYAAECNEKTEFLHSRVCFFEKWRDLVQTVVTIVQSDVETTASIAFDIATVLLEKMQQPDSSDLFFPTACSFISFVADAIAASNCAFDSTSPMNHLLKSVVKSIVYTRKANSGLNSRSYLYSFLLKFTEMNPKTVLHIFEQADENLLQVVLFDCSSNSAHSRLACLAYSLLQNFVKYDVTGRVFESLRKSRHVANICVSLKNASPMAEQFRLVDARIAFLTTLCLSSSEYCLLVVNSQPIEGLSSFNFNRLSHAVRQESSGHRQQNALNGNEHARLAVIFNCTLDFILAVFSTLPYNRLVAGEVSRFIMANSVLFAELLAKPSQLDIDSMEISSKTFAITCRCLAVLKNVFNNSDTLNNSVALEIGGELVSKLAQLKDAVFQSFVAYCDIGDLLSNLQSARPIEQATFLLPICRVQESLLMYASELITNGQVSQASTAEQLGSLVFSLSSMKTLDR